jgi:hypothetical protein
MLANMYLNNFNIYLKKIEIIFIIYIFKYSIIYYAVRN